MFINEKTVQEAYGTNIQELINLTFTSFFFFNNNKLLNQLSFLTFLFFI